MGAYKNIDFVLKGLEYSLQNFDKVYNVLYGRSIQLGEFVNTVPCKPRTSAWQIYRENHEVDSVKEYFHVSIIQPFLNNLVTEIKTHFDGSSLAVINGLYIFPDNVKELLDWW